MKLNFYKTIKNCLLLGFVSLSSMSVYAQTYTIGPSKTTTTTVDCNKSTDYLISVTNNGATDLSLSWIGHSNTLPSCWSYTLCDWETCYPGIPTTQKNPRALHASEVGTFKFTLNMTDTGGTGVAKVLLFPVGHPEKADTIQVTFNGCTTGPQCRLINGIDEVAPVKANMILSPNPAKDYIDIALTNVNTTSLNKIEVYNIIGNKLISVNPNKDEVTKINITELPTGLYFVKYTDKIGTVVTKRFNKVN